MSDLTGLSIFFPCYNDAGTIASMVIKADAVARRHTNNYEIIVIDDGSADHSRQVLEALKRSYDRLTIILHEKNRGYGGVLRHGFEASSKEWIFYTDGDAQYDVSELEKLIPLMTDSVDWVNGYKIKRHDPLHRILIGTTYQYLMKLAFGLKIRDVDCDFRLIRKRVFDRVELTRNSGVICVEMMKKFEAAGFRFAEVGVHHYFRVYGKSQIFNFKRLLTILANLIQLWWELVIQRKGMPQ